MVSYYKDQSWESEVYDRYSGSFLNRFSQSVELEGRTIETVAAMNDHSSDWPLFNHPCRQCAHCNMYGTTDFWAPRRTSV